eukprot:3954-Heterococcus_DN1.PRE.2
MHHWRSFQSENGPAHMRTRATAFIDQGTYTITTVNKTAHDIMRVQRAVLLAILVDRCLTVKVGMITAPLPLVQYTFQYLFVYYYNGAYLARVPIGTRVHSLLSAVV